MSSAEMTVGTPDGEGLLDRVALAINSSLDIDEVLERVATLALEACPADRSSIFLLDESGMRLVPTTYVAHPEISADIARYEYATRPHFQDMQPIDLEADPARSRAFRRGRAFMIPDLSGSRLVPGEVVTHYRARSAIVVPLIAPDEPLGVLALDWMTPQEALPETKLVLMEAIGAYTSLAIRNARLFENLNGKTRSLERLVEVASALNSSLSLRDVVDLACGSFAEFLGSDHCSVNLLEEGTVVNGSPDDRGEWSDERLRRLTPAEGSRIAELWQNSAEPLVTTKPPGDDNFVFSLCPPSVSSIAAFPLLHAEKIRGFVLAALPGSRGPRPEEVAIGRALAGLVATAMERAELYERVRTQLRHTEVLYGLAGALAGISNLSSALVHLNRLLGREIGIELEAISVANDRLREVLDVPSPEDEEMEAIRSWRAAPGRLRPRAVGEVVLVPIAYRARILGVMRIRPGGHSLDPASEELLLALGSACAEVIHKAGLRRDLAESERRLAISDERERIARDLHNSVGQLITGLGMRLASHAAEAPDDEWRQRLEDLVDLTAKGSRQMREAIHSMLFFQVRGRGLVRSLREMVQTFEATTGVRTIFKVRGRSVMFDPSKEDALFRVAHEAFTNIQRHSGTDSVSMTLTYESDEVALVIRDQGSGFGRKDPFRARPGHFGLLGIRRRLEEAGGELLVANAHPRGVLIEARVRLKRRRGLATYPGPHS